MKNAISAIKWFYSPKNKSGPQSEQVKKNIQKTFKEHGLDIIIQCNMKTVNYLDVTFNLNDGTYKLYTKPNNEIKYKQRLKPSTKCYPANSTLHRTKVIHSIY